MTRAKKPVDLLLVNGNARLTKAEIESRRIQEEALKPNTDKLKYPNWLTNPVARREYNAISKELQQINLMTNLDVNTLVSYCLAYALYIKASEELQSQPLLIEKQLASGSTQLVENPLVKTQLKYSNEMKALAATMGLSITSRMKLVVPQIEKKKENKFDRFASS